MSPTLALFLSLTFSLGLILDDRRRGSKCSLALWIPFLWLFLLSTRSVSAWMNLGPASKTSADYLMEGSPLDRTFFIILMVAAALVLIKRRMSLVDLVRLNPWLVLFFLYTGISLLWSEFPSISSKRWIKSFGDPLMVLVVLTEVDPARAVSVLFKRIAFIVLPLSVVFIKYFPELGRGYDEWTGWAFYTGVTTDKNQLGYVLFIFGLFFFCVLFGKHGRTGASDWRIDAGIAALFLGITAWLFRMADSQTPLLCLILACLVYVGSGIARVRRFWTTSIVTVLVVFVVLELMLDVTELIIVGAGRNLTLTGRTDLWRSVLELSGNPWFGTGYASYWLGSRLDVLWRQWPFRPQQAHNGYLEIYLNLGWVGLMGLILLVVSGYRTVQKRWRETPGLGPLNLAQRDFARFGMAFLVALIVYNITEATFQSMNLLFLVFLFVTMNRPKVAAVSVEMLQAPPKGLHVTQTGARSVIGFPPRALRPTAAARPSAVANFRVRS